MKTLLLSFASLVMVAVSWLPDWNTLGRAGEIREYKLQANAAFQKGDYEAALVFYRHLYDKLNITEEEVLLNLAHCYFTQKKNKQATALYQIATRSGNPKVKSLAWQQLGSMAYQSKRYEWAAVCFKNALKSSPTNEDARYNYELTQKILSLTQTKAGTPPPKQAPPPAPPPPPDADLEDESTTNDQSTVEPDPYSEMGLSKQQAEILLEAMKEAEKQYIQQQRKTSKKPAASSRPNW